MPLGVRCSTSYILSGTMSMLRLVRVLTHTPRSLTRSALVRVGDLRCPTKVQPSPFRQIVDMISTIAFTETARGWSRSYAKQNVPASKSHGTSVEQPSPEAHSIAPLGYLIYKKRNLSNFTVISKSPPIYTKQKTEAETSGCRSPAAAVVAAIRRKCP